MNILQLVSSSRTSGAEKNVVLLSQILRQMGHNVLAVCPPGGWLPEQLKRSDIPSVEMPMRGLCSVKAVASLRSITRRNNIDIIHTHLTRAAYLGYAAASFSKVPVVSSVHVFSRDIAYRSLPAGHHWFVTVSDNLRNKLIERGVSASRIETVHNGTEFVSWDRDASLGDLSVRAELTLPADAELIGLIGRVGEFKGHSILVHAAKAIVDRRPNAYFIFVGLSEPKVQQSLWEIACQDGIADRLRFTGVRNDIPRLMDAMDIVTVPSETETFGMVVIEAMAMGKPVVATRAGGIPELVLDQTTGLLVDRNPGAFSDAIISLLDQPARRLSMGREAKLRAGALFSATSMAQKMETLYSRILSETGPPRQNKRARVPA